MRSDRFSVVILASIVMTGEALAQDQPYSDDRSDGAALIRSYYNAINRKEYVRAWSYFGEDKPAPDLDTFANGFATTETVDLVTGNVSEEGAAGSVFSQVPIAIRATDSGGGTQIFAGCYTTRLANPQIQGEPFQPLHIVEGTLEGAQEPLEDALPASCGNAGEPEGDAAFDEAKELFAGAYGEICTSAPGGGPVEPESHSISYRETYDEADAPIREARLFQFYCGAGAYNESHVYYLAKQEEGPRELHFATPELDIRYENEDSEGAVESIGIIGYTDEAELVNSFYDPATFTITSFAKWRGVGDASSSGIWLFRNGRFTLVKYDVDASYDGEINPEVVLDYYSAP